MVRQFFKLLLLLVCMGLANANAQSDATLNNELYIRHDNDFFLLQGKDGYYSSGIFFNYSHSSVKNSRKRIIRWELGQHMYTTGEKRSFNQARPPFDRPYCGYLYLRHNRDSWIKKSQLFSWGVNLGVVGDWSLAASLQDWYHKEISLYNYAKYWDGQIPNELGVDATAGYAQELWSKKTEGSLFKMVAAADVTLGTFFINAKPGAWFCFGKTNSLQNSALLNSSISNTDARDKKDYELFGFFHPQLIVQGYNVTVQGGRFNKPDTSINWSSQLGVDYLPVSKPQTLMYMHTIGLVYARRRITLRGEYSFQTKEAISQRHNQQYGTVQIGYRF